MMPQVGSPSVKTRLLIAAADIFCGKGYGGTRISDIVARAGVAQGTFYLYFESKTAIFQQLVDNFFAHLMSETLGRNPATSIYESDDMIIQIRAIWRTILAYCRSQPQLTSLVMRESHALGPTHRIQIAEHYQRVVDALLSYTKEAMTRGIARQITPELAAWVILGMVERAIHYAVFVAPEADLDLISDDLVRFELGGLLADPTLLQDRDG